MMTITRGWGGVLVLALVCGAAAWAQTPPPQVPRPSPQPAPASAAEKAIIPLKVQVTLSRYDGEKKTSSLPFTLWVNANDREGTSLNVGSEVPIRDGNANSFRYRSLGTSLSSSATVLDDGRFRVQLVINDSSVAPAAKDGAGSPSFQSLSTQNYLMLRDGQTAQFVAATDKVTGEVTRVEVTVTVLK
jgi:hypothetical protein